MSCWYCEYTNPNPDNASIDTTPQLQNYQAMAEDLINQKNTELLANDVRKSSYILY
jgi:hypothetical protein